MLPKVTGGSVVWRQGLVALGFGLWFVGLTGVVAAQEGTDSPALKACLAKAETTAAIVGCQNDEMAALDRALNEIYKTALAGLPTDQKIKLRTAQRAWLDFRTRDCDVFYGKETGTLASVEAGGCMLTHTARRVEDLKAIAERP